MPEKPYWSQLRSNPLLPLFVLFLTFLLSCAALPSQKGEESRQAKQVKQEMEPSPDEPIEKSQMVENEDGEPVGEAVVAQAEQGENLSSVELEEIISQAEKDSLEQVEPKAVSPVQQMKTKSAPKRSKENQLGRRFGKREKPVGEDRYTVTLQDIETEIRIRKSRERPQLISLNFKETRLDAVIRLLGEVSGFNFVIHPEVGELKTTNMLLTDVTWEQALDIVLKTHNLAMRRTETVIMITTYNNLIEQQRLSSEEAEERKRQAEAQRQELEERLKSQQIAEVDQITFRTFKLNYAKAKDVKEHLLELYSGTPSGEPAGGEDGAAPAATGTSEIRISSFEADNSITVLASSSRLEDVAQRIEELDKPVAQVYIQARIVEIGKRYSKGLGIQWGGFFAANTGADFPGTVGVSGASGASQAGSNVGESAVNFPGVSATVNPITGDITPPEEGAGIGFNLAHVAGTMALNVRLTALEKEGKSRTISNPKIVTLNGKEAIITSGREIPVSTIDSTGRIKTIFVDATLELKVTPILAQDNSMLLTIEAKRDEVDFTRVVQGNPTILKKSVKTTIRVNNGGTAVLGGIFEERTSTTSTGVPGLRKIPILGKAFGSNKDADQGTELLIFITPTVVEQQAFSG